MGNELGFEKEIELTCEQKVNQWRIFFTPECGLQRPQVEGQKGKGTQQAGW